ncbi:MAG: alpha/beta fold hydrolase [Actinomycetota bacterium]
MTNSAVERSLEVLGATLATRSSNSPDDSSTLPGHVIWGHGLTSSMASEDEMPLIDWGLAAPSHQVIRYDARGHGRSESTDGELDYRWDRLAVDQLALADALDIDRYTAAGASMGAATALFAALAAPELIDRLILVIPPTAWDTRREQIDLYATMADLVEEGRTDVLVRGVDASPLPDPLDERARDRQKRTLTTTDPTRLARVLRGAGQADLPSPDDIAGIRQPALILAWTGDTGHPVSTAERLAELLPDSELRVASTADELATWSPTVAEFLAR